MNHQPNIPGLYSAKVPVEVSGADLSATIGKIEQAGFTVRRMDVDGTNYTLHLQRRPGAKEGRRNE